MIANCVNEPLGGQLVDRQLEATACHTHDSRDDVAGVQREAHRVTGQREFGDEPHHHAVADFTDREVVRILTHERADDFSVLPVRFIIGLVGPTNDGVVRKPRHRILGGLIDRELLLHLAVGQHVGQRAQRRRFPRTRFAGERGDAAAHIVQCLDQLKLTLLQPHVLREQHRVVLEVAVKQAKRDVIASNERRRLPSQVDGVRLDDEWNHRRLRRARLEAVAGIGVALNEVTVCGKQCAAHDRLGHVAVCVHVAVHAKPHFDVVVKLSRFEVNIARAVGMRCFDDIAKVADCPTRLAHGRLAGGNGLSGINRSDHRLRGNHLLADQNVVCAEILDEGRVLRLFGKARGCHGDGDAGLQLDGDELLSSARRNTECRVIVSYSQNALEFGQ